MRRLTSTRARLLFWAAGILLVVLPATYASARFVAFLSLARDRRRPWRLVRPALLAAASALLAAVLRCAADDARYRRHLATTKLMVRKKKDSAADC